jgi:hypothetical protein
MTRRRLMSRVRARACAVPRRMRRGRGFGFPRRGGEGGRRAGRRNSPYGHAPASGGHVTPSGAPSRRSRLGAGPRFRPEPKASPPRPSASSWQGAVVPPGGAPTPPGRMVCGPCARAPHRPRQGFLQAPATPRKFRISFGPPSRFVPPCDASRSAPRRTRYRANNPNEE